VQFLIRTYGCQMNVRDSEAVSALLVARGYGMAASEDEADVIVVNTCSVRGKAEAKALGKLGLLVAGKRDHPGRRVGVMGCMAQRLRERIFVKVPGLDFAVGTHCLDNLPRVLERVLQGGGPILDAAESSAVPEGLSGHLDGEVAAFVNILFGCDRFCTYCIVPHVRGRERSRRGDDIVEEIRGLVERGVREVTLLGQSVMSYGRRNAVWDQDHRSRLGFLEPLPRLLEAVADVPGISRIRFTSGHPSGCTEELARAMADLPAVCDHLHIPLQSGCDRILQMMKRGYTADEYRRAVALLRERVPGVAITTDLIVGFPSETEADFEETCRFCDEIQFDNAFVFKYSPRPGTKAAEWEDDVPAAEKLRRNKVLLERQEVRSLRINEALVGRCPEVLVEGPSLRDAARWSGRSRTNKIVVFDPEPGLKAGDLVRVRVHRARAQTLYGKIEKD
jgi:tRNA-2-methylthio-N6-dimethylallyladenosine synthase